MKILSNHQKVIKLCQKKIDKGFSEVINQTYEKDSTDFIEKRQMEKDCSSDETSKQTSDIETEIVPNNISTDSSFNVNENISSSIKHTKKNLNQQR